MALIRCLKCKSLFSETKKACLRCGEPVEQTSEKLIDENKLRDEEDKQVDGGFKLFGKGTVLFIIGLIILMGINKLMDDKADKVKQQVEAEQAKIELLKKEKNLKEFNLHKMELLKRVKNDINNKTYEHALETCNKNMQFEDKDLSPLCIAVKDAILKKEQQEREKAAKQEAARQEEELRASMSARAWKLHKKHPSWSIEDCKNVSERRYWVGMSLDMLKANRGLPDSANPSNFGNGTHWQWCWLDYTPSCFYDNDDDGIIDSYN